MKAVKQKGHPIGVMRVTGGILLGQMNTTMFVHKTSIPDLIHATNNFQ